jgi:hypothetical protein
MYSCIVHMQTLSRETDRLPRHCVRFCVCMCVCVCMYVCRVDTPSSKKDCHSTMYTCMYVCRVDSAYAYPPARDRGTPTQLYVCMYGVCVNKCVTIRETMLQCLWIQNRTIPVPLRTCVCMYMFIRVYTHINMNLCVDMLVYMYV